MLPSLGFQEIVLLAVLALVVVGPKDLPLMLRKLGRWTAKLRAMAQEFRSGFDELARQAELDELKKEVEALRRNQTLTDVEREITRPTLVSEPVPPALESPSPRWEGAGGGENRQRTEFSSDEEHQPAEVSSENKRQQTESPPTPCPLPSRGGGDASASDVASDPTRSDIALEAHVPSKSIVGGAA